jgi:glutathione S-transferase
MKLYCGPLSLFSRKVEIALHEKGLPYEREMVAFTQAKGYSPKHPAVLAGNPKAQVPVLVDGDLTLFDSTLIFEYLEDTRPKPALWPADPKMRARARLVELTADEILLPLVARFMHRSEPPDSDAERRERREAEAHLAESALSARYGQLNDQLQGKDFFCGTYSYADIAMFMEIFWALRLKGPRLGKAPVLEAWYERVGSRPAVAKIAAEIIAADRELSPALYS